ncbi:MAG: hypothetical protein OYL92_16915 [Acidobacteriota bacterium]|nr:hypothetical protein [Acidobacteriota bacterium]MDE2921733.1 hypothetical protein [Acidobacteriota bacterium]MDE3266648.1 hypothetical protein [Acidobacteriota bacterium]
MKAPDIDAAVGRIEGGDRQPVYLVIGEQVLADSAASRIAGALAGASGCDVATYKRPAELRPILADLSTFSLFDPAKVTLVCDSAIFADRTVAADLVDEAEAGLPVSAGDGLSSSQKEAAGRLLQALRLFGVAADAGAPEEAVSSLPDWVLQGGSRVRRRNRRGRTKKQCGELARDLGSLLEVARAEGLIGWSDGDLADLDRAADGGLPEGHALVFAERTADSAHPLVKRLVERKAAFQVGALEFDRRGNVAGLDAVVAELSHETGIDIDRDAAQELARRTLRKTSSRGEPGVEADSAARFAAEYRKIAETVRGGEGRINLATVKEVVVDRGDQDVWKLLDAIAEQRPDAALVQLRRHLDSAPERIPARLSFFALLARFCEQLATVHGLIAALDLPPERNYNRFKAQVLPKLSAELPGGKAHPLMRIHPYRLHRIFQAASARGPEAGQKMAALPWEVLETEVRLKGGSADGDIALEALVVAVAGAGAGESGGGAARRRRAG